MAARISYSYAKDKDELLARLNKIEGQVRGIRKMIEEDRYCADILQQIAALKSAYDAVALILLEDHLRGCTADAIRAGEGDRPIQDLVDVVRRFVRTSA